MTLCLVRLIIAVFTSGKMQHMLKLVEFPTDSIFSFLKLYCYLFICPIQPKRSLRKTTGGLQL